MRYSALKVFSQGLTGNKGWKPVWREPEPKPEYDVIIVGGGGHGLATAYYLAKEFGLKNIAVLERGWIGGGTQIRFVALGTDTYFAISQHPKAEAVKTVSAKLENTAYTTDQTDGWVALEITGAMARTALERICPIDLHPNQFKVNDIARTSMEHLGALIIRTDANRYLILSASSSARSKLHPIETSIKNVS